MLEVKFNQNLKHQMIANIKKRQKEVKKAETQEAKQTKNEVEMST